MKRVQLSILRFRVARTFHKQTHRLQKVHTLLNGRKKKRKNNIQRLFTPFALLGYVRLSNGLRDATLYLALSRWFYEIFIANGAEFKQ